MMDHSPALSMNSDMTDEELDQYLANYVPLSNLPTPPPAKESSMPRRVSTPASSTSRTLAQTHNVSRSSVNQAYAAHLANLVPLNVSTRPPHASPINGYLNLAQLPEEIVAFAGCMLDALSSRFASIWRDALAPSDHARNLEEFLRSDSRHVVRIRPEVIVLAALSLSLDFLADGMKSSADWSEWESNGVFTVQEIEATKRAILKDMDYGLLRISNDMVQRRLRDMQRPSTCSAMISNPSTKLERRRNVSLSLQGTAVWNHGVQTPEPSP
ncbi:hypothetical protein EJ02DRAFT_379579 [Clathrospora elynae]|uniref:Cyclin N-terminal domain-containing protein n=1 Tax=Clathrospora elynae TaxID=706981 RepID=A0A6A5SIU4_9PLEO|nr:hypothetical protein EJ02DRAFT_379579 [Clathrospora elynae]